MVFGGCSLERAPLQQPSEPLNPGGGDGGASMVGDSGVSPDGGPPDATASDAGIGDAASSDGGSPDVGQPDTGPGCVPAPEQCDALDNDCDDQVDEDDNGNQVCPCERDVFSGGTYLFCSQTESWDTASSECQSLGYRLVTIETMEEDDWISFGAGRTDNWWIGLTRIRPSYYEWITGVTVWDNGPIGYANFWDGQPNGGGGRNCGLLLDQSGRWWVERCGRDYPYVCEAPPAP